MLCQVEIPLDQIKAFCQRWKIVEFSLFGSVLRDDFRPDSDVDVLVTFGPDADHDLFGHVHMLDELKEIFGRDVDMAQEKLLVNPFRRRSILRSKKVVYASG
jgi:uncharacterized protein